LSGKNCQGKIACLYGAFNFKGFFQNRNFGILHCFGESDFLKEFIPFILTVYSPVNGFCVIFPRMTLGLQHFQAVVKLIDLQIYI
jgi:hypothetical protein